MSITSFVGAFPTDFVVPDDCSDLTSNTVVGFDFANTCLPENFDPDPAAYYSPGTGCPSGYTAQASCTRSSGGTSTVTCCPERGDLTLWCVEDPETLSDAWESLFCTWNAGNQETVLLVTVDDVNTKAVTMTGLDGINAYGLRMVYESSDLVKSTSATVTTEATSATETETRSGESVAKPTNTDTDSADSASDDGGGGLSTGAKVAIGVVIPVAVIALAVGLFFLYRRRKRSYGAVDTTELPAETKPGPSAYGGSGELYGSGGTSFHGVPNPQEMAGGVSAHEMPAQTFVSELQGSLPHEGSVSPSYGPPATPSPNADGTPRP
ncbi:hypothetical protein ACO1O0_005238 [Amphichorda felina]